MSALTALWGKSSWFGGPGDPTSGPTTASGASVAAPGIAVNNNATLGGYWAIKAPNGSIGLVKQTDIGPASWTGRKFDYTYSLLPLFGYSQQTFPTGGQTYGYYIGTSASAPSFGANLQTALKNLGATPSQSAGLMQSVDAGAIMQGKTAVVQPANQAPGTTLTQAGQAGSASEAVPSGISIPNPLNSIATAITDAFNTAVKDAKYAGVLVAVLALGAMLIFRAFSSGGGHNRTVVIPA